MIILQNLETIDSGKTFQSILGDVDFGVDVLRYFAGWSDKNMGKTIPIGNLSLIKVMLNLLNETG